jgi:hypothetical protein
MFIRKSVKPLVLSVFVLMTLCLLSSSTYAQSFTAEPVKGAVVKLAKYSGGQVSGSEEVVARTTTDANGNFTFSVVPAGKYIVIVERPKATENTSSARMQQGTVKFFNVRLKLAGGKQIEKDYDLDQKKAFEPAKAGSAEQTTSRTGRELVPFIFESDGATPCDGAINTTRSNIKNTSE